MHAPIILPDLSADKVVVSVWFADAGDTVYEGDRLVEVLIDGSTFDVSSPATGRLLEKHVFPDQELTPGQVLGLLLVDATESALTQL